MLLHLQVDYEVRVAGYWYNVKFLRSRPPPQKKSLPYPYPYNTRLIRSFMSKNKLNVKEGSKRIYDKLYKPHDIIVGESRKYLILYTDIIMNIKKLNYSYTYKRVKSRTSELSFVNVLYRSYSFTLDRRYNYKCFRKAFTVLRSRCHFEVKKYKYTYYPM